MGRVYASVEQLIGRTPLLELARLERALGLRARVLAKLEFLNPAGSVKDRAALSMIEDAERSGRLGRGSILVEPTSGNMGIGLAAVAAARGYRLIVVMPDSMSEERRRMAAVYGAEIVLTPGSLGMAGAIARAAELAASLPRALILGQFENAANPDAHFRTTGPEIYEDTDGAVDVFVCGVGTGGTLTGVGRYLKSRKPDARVVAVEPAGSPVLSGGTPGPHGLQGIGAGFVPATLDPSVYDAVVTVTEEEAFRTAALLARREGVSAGISSGAALHAALREAEREGSEGKTIVVLLPDGGDRYLSTPLAGGGDGAWMSPAATREGKEDAP